MEDKKKVIFSGAQPSGKLSIGNYIGALKNWVDLQSQYECFYCVVDMHAITVRQDPAELRRRTLETLAVYMACGIDPEQVTLFVQSHVPAHAELSWVLGCYTMFGELSRMTQFKEKSKKYENNINAGLFTYPVLMAADILLYNADLVPVGVDQTQHLELARNIAQRFNQVYAPTFVVPEGYVTKTGAKIMSLQDPEKKMSKSSASENSKIMLSDDPKKAAKKIMSATTDSFGSVKFDVKERPGISNLLQIEALINNRPLEDVVEEWEGCERYGDLKKKVAESVENLLTDFQDKYREISDDQAETLLIAGEKYAKNLAEEKLNKVYEKLGLV